MSPFSSRDRAFIRHPAKSAGGEHEPDPDNVPAKAGNQTPNDHIELSLDSGHPPPANSGMTGSCNHVIPAQVGIQASLSNLYLWISDLVRFSADSSGMTGLANLGSKA
jgi:hypothetical protein